MPAPRSSQHGRKNDGGLGHIVWKVLEQEHDKEEHVLIADISWDSLAFCLSHWCITMIWIKVSCKSPFSPAFDSRLPF